MLSAHVVLSEELQSMRRNTYRLSTPRNKACRAVCCKQLKIAYLGNYLVSAVIFKWGNSFVDPHKRASYSAGKEMLSLIAGMVMTLLLGVIMDSFETAGNLNGGFIFAAISILIFSVSDLICLLLIKKQTRETAEKREIVPMREVIKNTMGNRNFRSVVVLTILWDVARYVTVGFLGVYRIGELAFFKKLILT